MSSRLNGLALATILAMGGDIAIAAGDATEIELHRAIRAANASTSLEELTRAVDSAAACCANSASLGRELTHLLREGHPIYSDRLPTEVSRFRGFLLASLGAFPSNEERFVYVKAELQFGGHAFDVAAAAVSARGFADRAPELLPLFAPYLGDTFMDQFVDVTTPELNYPLANPTTARREIVRTLGAFGARASPSVPLLETIAHCPSCGTFAFDIQLPVAAAEAARSIRMAALPAAEAGGIEINGPPPLQLIDAGKRTSPVARSLPLTDQEGRNLEFAELRGRPFVMAFLYSRCSNPQKCALTTRQLGLLAAACADDGLAAQVGVYGITYDPQFDAPSILKRFGSMYGMKYAENVRLFKTTDDHTEALRDELGLRVNYGAGSVNHHGVQLFVFDKKGRLAALQDNEAWAIADVQRVLTKLAAE